MSIINKISFKSLIPDDAKVSKACLKKGVDWSNRSWKQVHCWLLGSRLAIVAAALNAIFKDTPLYFIRGLSSAIAKGCQCEMSEMKEAGYLLLKDSKETVKSLALGISLAAAVVFSLFIGSKRAFSAFNPDANTEKPEDKIVIQPPPPMPPKDYRPKKLPLSQPEEKNPIKTIVKNENDPLIKLADPLLKEMSRSKVFNRKAEIKEPTLVKDPIAITEEADPKKISNNNEKIPLKHVALIAQRKEEKKATELLKNEKENLEEKNRSLQEEVLALKINQMNSSQLDSQIKRNEVLVSEKNKLSRELNETKKLAKKQNKLFFKLQNLIAYKSENLSQNQQTDLENLKTNLRRKPTPEDKFQLLEKLIGDEKLLKKSYPSLSKDFLLSLYLKLELEYATEYDDSDDEEQIPNSKVSAEPLKTSAQVTVPSMDPTILLQKFNSLPNLPSGQKLQDSDDFNEYWGI